MRGLVRGLSERVPSSQSLAVLSRGPGDCPVGGIEWLPGLMLRLATVTHPISWLLPQRTYLHGYQELCGQGGPRTSQGCGWLAVVASSLQPWARARDSRPLATKWPSGRQSWPIHSILWEWDGPFPLCPVDGGRACTVPGVEGRRTGTTLHNASPPASPTPWGCRGPGVRCRPDPS